MPAMHFRLRWPDGAESICYSPSLVIADYFSPGTTVPLDEFLPRIREALGIASERVRAKFGFACSRALDQLEQIETIATVYADWPQAQVRVLSFDSAT
jgi:uncharacterized repeat protein (TIGR04042 family)